MSCVIIAGSSISFVRCEPCSDGVEITGIIEQVTTDRYVFDDPEKTEEVFRTCIEHMDVPKDAIYEDWHVVFMPPSVVYRTWQVPTESLTDSSDRTAEEKEQRVLHVCSDDEPEGLTELYSSWAPALVSDYYMESMTTLTAAYLPQIFVDNITEAADRCGIVLMGITEAGSSLRAILNPEADGLSQYICKLSGSIVAVNPFGAAVWAQPGNVPEEYGLNILDALTQANFGLDPSVMNVYVNDIDISHCLSHKIITPEDFSESRAEMALIAAGAVCRENRKTKKTAENTEKKGADQDGLANRVRQFFKKA